METKQHIKNNGLMKRSKRNQKYVKINENKISTFQNLQDSAKVVLRGKYIAIKKNKKNLKQPKTT